MQRFEYALVPSSRDIVLEILKEELERQAGVLPRQEAFRRVKMIAEKRYGISINDSAFQSALRALRDSGEITILYYLDVICLPDWRRRYEIAEKLKPTTELIIQELKRSPDKCFSVSGLYRLLALKYERKRQASYLAVYSLIQRGVLKRCGKNICLIEKGGEDE